MKCPQCGKEMEEFIGQVRCKCRCGCTVCTNVKNESRHMTEREILEGVQLEFGAHHEMFVALEELSELQKEICKDLRDEGDDDAIAEEMADVQIVLAHLEMMYNNAERVADFRKEKLMRLERMLKEDY